MKCVTSEQMRELDRRTMEEAGIPGEALMDHAGYGIAEVVGELAEMSGLTRPSVLLLAGRGNNGGDAFVAARYLKERECRVEVWLAGSETGIKGDALKHLGKMKAVGVLLRQLPTVDDWEGIMHLPSDADIMVDGLLGTGTSGPARGPVARAIQYINMHADEAVVVAIDVPSGLDADRGQTEGDVIHADVTVTMGLPKIGLVRRDALECVGSIEVVDIGIPYEFVSDLPEVEETLIHAEDLKPLMPRRPRDSHKGTYGHVLMMGGARGYAGAIALAARGAQRSGAGLVSVAVPERIASIVASGAVEAMVSGYGEIEAGALSVDCWKSLRQHVEDYSAVLVGPGLSRCQDALVLVRHVIKECQVPLVLDADALAVLEGQPHWIEKASCPVVITPHPGEMALLFGQGIQEIQADRVGVAEAAAKFTGATVVLKGAGTVVATNGQPPSINLTGNPGMATGGSGDVLAGVVVGLLAQGMAPHDAARAAVYIHGRAGDIAAWRGSQAGLIAGDIVDELPYAIRSLTLR
jgi:hydroxyethylthiazole kinase-like uncharacterized protein yjeF